MCAAVLFSATAPVQARLGVQWARHNAERPLGPYHTRLGPLQVPVAVLLQATTPLADEARSPGAKPSMETTTALATARRRAPIERPATASRSRPPSSSVVAADSAAGSPRAGTDGGLANALAEASSTALWEGAGTTRAVPADVQASPDVGPRVADGAGGPSRGGGAAPAAGGGQPPAVVPLMVLLQRQQAADNVRRERPASNAGLWGIAWRRSGGVRG